MAQRDLTNMQSVVNVVSKNPSQLPQAVANFGKQILQQNQEARITENMSKVQLELNALDTQYQIDNEKNPTGNIEEYKQQRQELFDKYGSEISPLYSRVWNDNVRKVATQNDASQQGWIIKQTRTNTVNSINTSIKDSIRLANMNGQNYGNGDQQELGAFVDFENSRQSLSEFASKNLGEETTRVMMEDYERDYMKSFVSGVAYSNPQRAAQIMKDDRIKGMFTSDEMTTMESMIERQHSRVQYGGLLERMGNDSNIIDLVLNGDGNDYEKRLEIDTLALQGKINPKTAVNARRVLESRKALNAITNTDTMSGIITQMYDLNAMAETNPTDYLVGVENLRNEIAVQQANGNLSTIDAQKLNNQLRTLSGKKTADATQRVGYEFYDANEKFNVLPPQYRGQATRELFYKQQGNEEMTKEQQQKAANEIIDNIRSNIRNNTLKTIQNLNKKNEDFLKTTLNPNTKKPYTMSDVKETAELYGITEDMVIQKMKAQ